MKRAWLIAGIVGAVAVIAVGIYIYVKLSNPERPLWKGNAYKQAGEYEKAYDSYRTYSFKAPEDVQGYLLQAEMLINLSRYDEARQILEGESDQTSLPGVREKVLADVPCRILLVEAYLVPSAKKLDLERGDPLSTAPRLQAVADELKKCLEMVSQIQSEKPKEKLDILSMRGEILAYLGDTSELLRGRYVVDQGRTRGADAAALDQQRQQAAKDKQKYHAEAINVLLEVVSQENTRIRDAERLARLCSGSDSWESFRKVRDLFESMSNPPAEAFGVLTVTELYRPDPVLTPAQQTDRRKQLLTRLDDLRKANPKNLPLKKYRTQLALDQGDLDLAGTLCDEVLEAEPKNADFRLFHGRLLLARAARAEQDSQRISLYREAKEGLESLVSEFKDRGPGAYYYASRAIMKQAEAEFDVATRGLDPKADAAAYEAAASRRKGVEGSAYTALRKAADLGWVDARIEYAQYLLDQGANERAMEDAQASYRQAPDQPKAVEVMVRAAMALSQTDLAKATLEEASNLPYKSAKMYDVIREGWTALKDEARARAAAEAARKQDPTSLDGREAMARSLVRENRFAEAEAIMLKAIEQEPNMPGLHVTLGAIYDLDGRGLDALQEYRKAVEIQPSSARWRVILAQALANRGQSDQSLREFEQARALDPKDLDILFAHLQLSIRMGLPVRSDDLKRLETYQRGAKLAMAYAQGGQIDKAIQECRAVLDKEPSNRDALWVLARAYQLSDRPESARTELTKLLTLNPEDDQAYVDLVRLLSRQSSMDEVRAAMGSIRGLLSTKIDLAIARLLLTDARYEAAAEAFGRVVADSKAKADIRHEALLNRVSALAMANQTDQALREIEPLLSEAAWKMEASLTKAAMLISVKKLDDAKSLLAQIRTEAQRTKNNRLLERLVRVYMSIPAADEALATCDRLETVLVEGQTADAHQLRAGVLVAAGRPAEALPYYQKALEARPQAFVIRRDLARVLELSGRPLEARKQLEMLVTAGAGDTARLLGRLELADMYGRWGMSQKALAVLRDVVADGYDDPAVRLATGKALANLGQKDEATKQFRTITPFDKQYVEAQQMMVRMTSDRTARREILNNLAVKRPNDPDVLRFTLQALADSGDWMEADGQFREFSRDNYARTVPPQDIAVMAVSIRAELGRLEDAGALAALMYKDTKSAIWRATALCLMVDRQSDDAKALLPPVAEATYFDAVYGYLLHRRGPQGPAWLSRLKTLRDEPLPLSAKPPVPALSRLLVSLVIGEDPAAAQAALAKEGFLARLAGDELIAYAKANATSAANEAAELLKAETARLVPFASMAHALSMKILQKRPECLAAAALACETKPNSDVYRQVADIVRPADGVLARAFRGALLSMENKHPEAISVLQGLVADGHGESAVLSWLARSLEAAGRKAEAAKYYRELWKLNPQDIRAANNAAYLLALSNPTDKQTLSEARAWIAEAVAKAPGVLAIRDTSGWIAYLEGRNQDAVVDLLAASRAIPGSPEVHAHLGLAALAVGDQELSRLHLEAAVSLYQAVLDAKLEATPAMTEAVNQARGALDKNWPDWQKGRA